MQPPNDTVATEQTPPTVKPLGEGENILNGGLMAEVKELAAERYGGLMDELRERVEQRVGAIVNPPEPTIREPDLSDLSEVEREQALADQALYREQIEALSFENELLTLGREYPREVATLQRMLESGTVEGYVEALHAALNPAPREPEDEVHDVDRNNPASTPYSSLLNRAPRDLVHLPDGSVLTVEEAEAILRSARSLHD